MFYHVIFDSYGELSNDVHGYIKFMKCSWNIFHVSWKTKNKNCRYCIIVLNFIETFWIYRSVLPTTKILNLGHVVLSLVKKFSKSSKFGIDRKLRSCFKKILWRENLRSILYEIHHIWSRTINTVEIRN